MLICLRFDKFLLYPTEDTVMCGEIELDIHGKDFEVLHLLLQHPRRVVSKEIILNKVWPDVFVEEANIHGCINRIRKNLRLYSETQELIENVRGKGYKLVVDVVEVVKEADEVQDNGVKIAPDSSDSLAGKIWSKIESALTDAKNLIASLQQENIELQEKLELEKGAYKKLSEDFEHRLEYRVGKLEIRVTINDYDGYCHTRWICADITKKRPDAVISSMAGYLRFSTPDCSIKKYPVLSSHYNNDYKLNIVTRTTNSCEFYVHAIKPTDKMSYEYVADIDHAFCMTSEELIGQRYEHEWYGYHVISAIEVLVINLYFPDSYIPTNIQLDAHIGYSPTELSNSSEIERIIKENGFIIRENGTVSMIVNRPKINYRYSVRWQPLPSALVEVMRQRQSLQSAMG